uniref:Peptidoglycan recognition protein 1 n=1 Tax=Gopherus agassizii TaxID=38772 RepID=A0A452IAW9_9SAUR
MGQGSPARAGGTRPVPDTSDSGLGRPHIPDSPDSGALAGRCPKPFAGHPPSVAFPRSPGRVALCAQPCPHWDEGSAPGIALPGQNRSLPLGRSLSGLVLLQTPEPCCCPTIVSRRQWGARPPRSRVPLRTPVPYVIIHHTTGNRCTSQASCSQEVKGIQNYHMNTQRWSDIGYNFLIGEDGRVYEGRGWKTMGAHAKKWNHKSLGFSFLGNFSNRIPSAAALNAAKSLIQCAISRGFLKRSYTVTGHRNVNPTSCPGNALYRVITQWPRFKAKP